MVHGPRPMAHGPYSASCSTRNLYKKPRVSKCRRYTTFVFGLGGNLGGGGAYTIPPPTVSTLNLFVGYSGSVVGIRCVAVLGYLVLGGSSR